MNCRLFTGMLCVGLALAVPAQAQFEQDPDDAGVADSIDMRFSVIPDATTNQLEVQMDLYFFNDQQDLASASVGFAWDNPNLQMDSAFFSEEAAAAFNYLQILYRSSNIDITNAYQQFQFSGSKLFSAGLLASSASKLVASYFFTLGNWDVSDSIVLDTVVYGGGTIMKFVDVDLEQYVPYWDGRRVIRDTAVVIPSNLVVSEDTLFFNSIEGEPSPPAQTVQITSDYAPLEFSLMEDAAWLLKSPSVATTPASVLVSVSTAGLANGTYFDSISVESPGADNSPQFIYVKLQIVPPPPLIGVNRQIFYFNAVVDSTNPPQQTLVIENVGGEESTLNWSVANSQGWLSLSPTSGVDSGDVTLNVDITGLSTGMYFDTVVVSDPSAGNSPVEIPVDLRIGTDLPVLDVDSVIYSAVSIYERHQYIRKFGVRNAGAGALDFWVESNSKHVVYMRPDSSSAPDTVTVVFEFDDLVPTGYEWTDTIWVYSAQAINSPVMVSFNFRLVIDPPVIVLSVDTLIIDIYECDQGYHGSVPREIFEVDNGGDDPLNFYLQYASDLFVIDDTSGLAPEVFAVTALETDLPVGSYLDTVTITSVWASNSPQLLFVQYNVIPGDQPPEILLTRTEFDYLLREGSAAQVDTNFEIYNVEGGCMAWQITGEVGWLVPEEVAGNVPAQVDFLINPSAYSLGEYVDSFLVVAGAASNSPQTVDAVLRVWRLYGDMNWDGVIDVSDVTLMTRHLFMGGPGAQPAFFIGDVDCNDLVDIGDLTALIRHLWIDQQPLCGNP